VYVPYTTAQRTEPSTFIRNVIFDVSINSNETRRIDLPGIQVAVRDGWLIGDMMLYRPGVPESLPIGLKEPGDSESCLPNQWAIDQSKIGGAAWCSFTPLVYGSLPQQPLAVEHCTAAAYIYRSESWNHV
jgi:hypothetical protein